MLLFSLSSVTEFHHGHVKTAHYISLYCFCSETHFIQLLTQYVPFTGGATRMAAMAIPLLRAPTALAMALFALSYIAFH